MRGEIDRPGLTYRTRPLVCWLLVFLSALCSGISAFGGSLDSFFRSVLAIAHESVLPFGLISFASRKSARQRFARGGFSAAPANAGSQDDWNDEWAREIRLGGDSEGMGSVPTGC
jgi:hypothetical protein